MPAFQYTALNSTGKKVKGILDADSPRLVRQLLREQQLSPLHIEPLNGQRTKGKKQTSPRINHRRKISTKELALLTRQIATLLQAGLPLEETLRAVAEQTEKASSRAIVSAVRSHLLEGFSFAHSLGQFPKSFTPLFCATVAAGEASGHLDIVLNRLAEYVEQQQHMRQKVQQALIYPIIMTLVSLSIVVFLLIYVVPQMIKVFSNIGQALPEMTLLLISISHFLQHYGLYLLLALIVLAVLFHFSLKKTAFRSRYHRFLLRLPLIGHISRLGNTSRFIRTFGILSQAGVSVIEAMSTASKLMTNLPIRQATEAATQKVKEGANIHLALKQTSFFQPMTIHLIATGEASGSLDEMLSRASNNQDQEIEQIINTTLTLFEPLMILVMGSVVLFIVLAVLLPIFSLDNLGG